jgi:hypothetical protein
MEDDGLFSFWYAYEGGIMLVLMHAALSARAASTVGLNGPHGLSGLHGLSESEIGRATDPVVFTDAAECSICIAPHASRGSVKLACGHCFHAQCIARWLGRARTCPVCRGPVGSVGPVGPNGPDESNIPLEFDGPIDDGSFGSYGINEPLEFDGSTGPLETGDYDEGPWSPLD